MLESVESRTRALLIGSFAALVLLMAVGGVAGVVALDRIRGAEERLRSTAGERTARLERLRSNLYLAGVLAQEYFASPAPNLAAHLDRVRSDIASAAAPYASLNGEVIPYLRMLDLMQDVATRPRTAALDQYLRGQMAQRRRALERIEDDVATTLSKEAQRAEQDLAGLHARFRRSLAPGLLALVAAAVGVAFVTARRLGRLEAEARSLGAQLVRAQEEERRAVARELHDDVGQALSGLLMDVGGAARLESTAEIRPRLTAIQAKAEDVIDAVRRVALSLRPSMLDDLGLVAALEWQAREAGKRAGIPIQVVAREADGELPESHRTCIYRVAQEALRNSVRHAGASHISVRLERTAAGIALRVEDDGRGFRPSARGVGMLGMEERLAHLGGRLRIDSAPGRGTTVTAELPL
jgi:signal transduction histidine kinase